MFIDYIKPVSLPTPFRNTNVNNVKMYVAGWGCTTNGKKILLIVCVILSHKRQKCGVHKNKVILVDKWRWVGVRR